MIGFNDPVIANAIIQHQMLWEGKLLVCQRYIKSKVQQCKNCYNYGHTDENCTRSKVRGCTFCSNANHPRQDCRATQPRCILCKGAHPAAGDPRVSRCREHQAEVARLKEKIRRAARFWPVANRFKQGTTQHNSESGEPPHLPTQRGPALDLCRQMEEMSRVIEELGKQVARKRKRTTRDPETGSADEGTSRREERQAKRHNRRSELVEDS